MKKHYSVFFSLSLALLFGLTFLIFGAASRGTHSGAPEQQVVQGAERQGPELIEEGMSLLPASSSKTQAPPAGSPSREREATKETSPVASKGSFKQRVAQKILLRKIRKLDKKSKKGGLNSGKNQLVAFLLCFFVGVLGIHRFYLGYVGIGVIQLLTGGLCGLWTLIDLILILVGSLKPKDGEYGETF